MHLIRIDTVSLDEGEAAIDLGQTPGEIVLTRIGASSLARVVARPMTPALTVETIVEPG